MMKMTSNHKVLAKVFTYLLLLTPFLFVSCSQQLPSDFTQADALPMIYPDYVEVTVPVNIDRDRKSVV